MNPNGPPSFTISMNDPQASAGGNDNGKNPTNTADSNKSLEYILTRNQTLDAENKTLREEIAELKAKLEEEEDNNDRNDSRMVHMKGLTKNVVAGKTLCEKIKNNSVKIHSIYKNINTETDKFSTELNKVCLINVSIFLSIIFMFALFSSYTLLSTFLFIVIGNAYFFSEHYKRINKNYLTRINKLKGDIVNYENVIRELDIELKEIKNATDFLNDHIDGI